MTKHVKKSSPRPMEQKAVKELGRLVGVADSVEATLSSLIGRTRDQHDYERLIRARNQVLHIVEALTVLQVNRGHWTVSERDRAIAAKYGHRFSRPLTH
jgi:hypothetical protein